MAVRLARHRVHRPDADAGPPGPRDSDGVWAPYWYDAVVRSTGFEPWRPRQVELSEHDAASPSRAAGLRRPPRARLVSRSSDACTCRDVHRAVTRLAATSVRNARRRAWVPAGVDSARARSFSASRDRAVERRVGVDHRAQRGGRDLGVDGGGQHREDLPAARARPTFAPTSTPRSASSTSLTRPSALAIQPRVEAARSVVPDAHVEPGVAGLLLGHARRTRPRGR